MAGPYYTTDNYGVTRLTDQAPNFSKGDGVSPGGKGSGAEAAGVGGLPGGKKVGSGGSIDGSSSSTPNSSQAPQVSPEQLAALQQQAAAGDTNAQAYLDILLATGAAGGVFLAHALRSRGKGTPQVGMGNPGTSLVPSSPPVTRVQEEVIPRAKPEKRTYLPKKSQAKIDVGGQARAGAADRKLVTNKPTNPRNLPATKQGEVDAAYSQKKAQDAKYLKDKAGANPGRVAKEARIRDFGSIIRRVIR